MMNKNDTWVAGSNRVDWFIENEMTDVRLDICALDAELMTDEEKWEVVRHIVNILNGCVVENDTFKVTEQYAIVDDGHEHISTPDNVITCSTKDYC